MIQKLDLKGVCLDGTDNQRLLASASPMKRDYVKVPDKKRQQLIQLLQETQLTIKAAAARLGIHYSAAKCIVKVFKQEKRVVALTRRVKTPASFEEIGPIATKKTLNELSTLTKTPELVFTISKTTKEGKEGEVWFDFGVYGSWMSERYGTFKY
eukprot:TRINITY_DN523_c0_g1_i20.p1 TRINITY_DN523_c0_g1~~TRINITY_DN523_c0_g1_i20.p1  ORF type:complete len:154 (+),score=31.33 TRINITY_DN523_c0_g1_i20:211-672(+)